MEEIISLIQDGCKLARDLELNLTSSLATQPAGMLSYHCEEIIKAFGNARERLILFSQGQHIIGQASLEEWLRSTNYYYSQATDTIQARILGGNASGGHVQAMDVSYSVGNSTTTTSSSQPRPRKRKDENNIRTEIMAAAQIGNTEIPLDDGFIWRKYGQKEILGSKFPRSYYRCTHQKLYSCPAKKQVQRDDEDPHMFIVTYRGNHTCNISGTSPSALSQPSDQMSNIHDHQILIGQAMSNNGPLSLTNSYSVVTTTPLLSRTGLSVDYGKELADQFSAVVDMADAMFNSGGSYSTNSMEFLFPSMESADDHPRKLNDYHYNL